MPANTIVNRDPFHDVPDAKFKEMFSAYGDRPGDADLLYFHLKRKEAEASCVETKRLVAALYNNPRHNHSTSLLTIEVGKLLKPRVEAITKALSAAHAEAIDKHKAVQREIASKLKPATGDDARVAADIRRHFASLPEAARGAAISQALSTEDKAERIKILKALVSEPAFLSGQHPARVAVQRKDAINLIDPNLLFLDEAYEAEIKKLSQAVDRVGPFFAERFDFAHSHALSQLAQG